jgi:hypothetical protein
MRTLRLLVTVITRQPPRPAPLYFVDFASKPAWYAPFQVLPYFRLNNRPTEFCPAGHSLLTRTTVVVLWAWWTACTFRAAPHVASDERCAAPHVASDDRRAALHVVHDDRRAALDAVSYRMLLEPLVLQWSVLERLVLERLVMAVPEPQHLTLLARWSAGPRRRLVREVKTRLDARSVFHSCWRPPKWTLLPM